MATLTNLYDDVLLALDTAGYQVASQWSAEPRLTDQPVASIKIASSSQADAGSNLRVRLAEVVVEVSRNRYVGGVPTEAIEGFVTTYLEELTEIDFWSALSSVRASPLPEVEVETEPTNVGTVIFFAIRAQCVLEV